MGAVIGIGLAISVLLLLILVGAGLLFAYIKRRREGYQHPPQEYEKNVHRIPPDTLFGNLRNGNEATGRPYL